MCLPLVSEKLQCVSSLIYLFICSNGGVSDQYCRDWDNNPWFPNGKNNLIILKLAKHRPLNCKEVPTLLPHYKTLLVRVWISLIQNLTRSEESAKKRRRKKGARKEKRWFGTESESDGRTASKANTLDNFLLRRTAAIHLQKVLAHTFSSFSSTLSVIDPTANSQETNAIGPGIGPAAIPPPLASLPPGLASLPAPPQTANPGTYSAFGGYSLIWAATHLYIQHPIASDATPFALSRPGRCSNFGYQPAANGAAPPTMEFRWRLDSGYNLWSPMGDSISLHRESCQWSFVYQIFQ